MPQYRDRVGNGYWAEKPAHPDDVELRRSNAEKWDMLAGEGAQEGIDKPTSDDSVQEPKVVKRRKSKRSEE